MIKAPPAPPEVVRLPTQKIELPEPIIVTAQEKVFYHSGDIGDIIYSLLFIKEIGGGKLYIGPDTKWDVNSKRDPQRYRWLLPLLKIQPYLTSAEYADRQPGSVTHDLNRFREIWMTNSAERQKLGLRRLFEAYPKRFGTGPLPEDKPWLTVPNPIEDPKFPVVIHRSGRYQNNEFPWDEAVRRYGFRMKFCGTTQEWNEWTAKFGKFCELAPCSDALALARLIAGCQLFIGNQSCANAIALGLGKALIQETSPKTPDCVFKRPNSQFCFRGPVRWPDIGHPYVLPYLNPNGFYELGPAADADGMGDTLSVTPIAKALGARAIMRLPRRLERFAFLFEGLCPIEFTDAYPVFRHVGGVHSGRVKLELFGLHRESSTPVINVPEERIKSGHQWLADYSKPVCFVPTCAAHWAHLRQRPPDFWEPILARFKDRTFLQFGREDYLTVPGATRMPFVGLQDLSGIYAACGQYLGVDTGDAHLMIAAGGRITVAVPDAAHGYPPKEWQHQDPRARYFNFNRPWDAAL